MIWDRLFGTYQREQADEPAQYGVTHSISQPYSLGYLNTFLYLECLRQAWGQHSLKAALGVLLGPPSRLQLTTVAKAGNRPLLTTCLGLLTLLLISFYVVFNSTELSAADAWRVPLSLLLISCLYMSPETIGYRWSPVTLLVKGLEAGLILYLLTHYNDLKLMLWLALVSIVLVLAANFISSYIARNAPHE